METDYSGRERGWRGVCAVVVRFSFVVREMGEWLGCILLTIGNRHVGRISVPSQTGGFSPLSSTRTPLPGNHPLFGETMRRSRMSSLNL